MKDCEKLYLVFYIDISQIGKRHVPEFISDIADHFTYDETVNTIMIPIEGTDTHVECLNGKDIDEDTQKKIDELYSSLKEAMDKYKNTSMEHPILYAPDNSNTNFEKNNTLRYKISRFLKYIGLNDLGDMIINKY